MKKLKEGALLEQIVLQTAVMENHPTGLANSVGVSGVPTKYHSKQEVLVTTGTKKMTLVIQPKVGEIRKIAVPRS